MKEELNGDGIRRLAFGALLVLALLAGRSGGVQAASPIDGGSTASAAARLAPLTVTGQSENDEIDRVIGHIKKVAVPRWLPTLAAMLAVTLVSAFVGGLRFGAGGARPAGDAEGPQLPESVRSVRVLGKSYQLDTLSGQVLDATTWTETITNVSHYAGGVSVQGGVVYHDPGRVEVSTTVTQKDRIWLRCPDRSEHAWLLTNANFPTRKDQLVSIVARRVRKDWYESLVAYNHDTRQFDTFSLGNAHRIPFWFCWLLATAVGTLGGLWGLIGGLQSWVAERAPGTPMGVQNRATWRMVLAAAAAVALVVVGIVSIVISLVRTMVFRTRYLPAIRKSLQAATPELRGQFTGVLS